ncbi:CWF19-like protein 2 -like protein [Trichinella sp. T6]|nr:CWF19-like protein 2 -like protein [Trichinella sp. T6]
MTDRNRDEASRNVSSSSVDDSVDYLCAFTGGEVRRNLRRQEKERLNKAEKRAALELNPYWKDGGNGLPPENCSESSFKKPKFLNDDDCRVKVQFSVRHVNNDQCFQYGKNISGEVSGSYIGASETVKAKPLQPKLARKLVNEYDHRGKEFVRSANAASSKSNLEASERNAHAGSITEGKLRDELNKLKAKLFRAEMMGDQNQIKSLKEAIEHFKSNDSISSEETGSKEVVLTKMNIRKGTTFLVDPVDNEKKDLNVRDMLKKEKMMTDSEDFDVYHFPTKSMSEKHTEDWTVDDMVLSRMQKSGSSKQAEKIRAEQIRDFRRQEQKLDTCVRCVEGKLDKHFVIAFGNQTYLALPKNKPLVRNHCLIVPLNHVSSCAQMDEDVLDEIKFWREKLVAMFRTQSLCCIFFETAKNVKHMPHCFLECIPVSKKIFECAPMYFKIPAGFSYFVVYFGLEGGMAHIIENESLVPSWFGQEVIGGMLGLEYNQWRKPANEVLEQQVKRVTTFKKQLKEFDSTIFQK